MATCSSVPAWRIPWPEEPGVLPPWGHTEWDAAEHVCRGNEATENLTSRLRMPAKYLKASVGFSPLRVLLRYFSDAQSAGIQMFVHYPKSLPAADDAHRLAICRPQLVHSTAATIKQAFSKGRRAP